MKKPITRISPRSEDTYAPIVHQCRYSGIEVSDGLWRFEEFGVGKKYSDNQAEHMVEGSRPSEEPRGLAFAWLTLELAVGLALHRLNSSGSRRSKESD